MVTDEEGILISRSRNGDWDAFAALIQSNQRMIYSLAYRMSGPASDAQDLAQETFVRAYQNLDSYRGTAKFSSWLYRIAINLSLRWKKREDRRAIADSVPRAAAVGKSESNSFGGGSQDGSGETQRFGLRHGGNKGSRQDGVALGRRVHTIGRD
jgi:DNA-directed RNA polymerase specialized sigma24 family protein